MTEWISKPLGEVTSLMSKGIAPAYVDIEGDSTVRVLNQKCNRDYRISYEESRINDLTKKSVPDERFLQPGDVLINSTGTGTAGRIAQIWDIPCQTTIDGHMILIRPSSNLDPLYFGYALKQCQSQVELLAEGSTGQTEINRKRLCNEVIITFPESISKQKEVASILSSIDDKIELNERINHNLEQQAQAIFKSWFVDLEPFGGVKPDDWQEGTLGQYVDIKRGGSPRPIQDFLADNGLRWLKISDVTSLQSPYVLDIKEHIKESGLRKTVFLKSGALVLSNSATPGIPKILGVDTCIHDGWLYFPSSLFSNEYLYLFFKYIREKLVALGNGSVFTNLKTDILKSYSVSLPNEQTRSQFDDLVVPMFQEMKAMTMEVQKLTEVRDTLLPRLMSGELDVSEVNI